MQAPDSVDVATLDREEELVHGFIFVEYGRGVVVVVVVILIVLVHSRHEATIFVILCPTTLLETNESVLTVSVSVSVLIPSDT